MLNFKKQLTQLIEHMNQAVDDAYKRGYEKGKAESTDDACKNCLDKGDADAAYQNGLDDAWNAMKKLHFGSRGIDGFVLEDIFGTQRVTEILATNTVTGVIEKIREYEERKAQEDAEIKVGDFVYNQNNYRDALVLKVYDDDTALVMEQSKSGIMIHTPPLRALSKKNRHVDLSELFRR